MARLSRARRERIGRAVRAYHRTVRAIVRQNPGATYRHAQTAYRVIRDTRDLRPTASYVRTHPRITRATLRSRSIVTRSDTSAHATGTAERAGPASVDREMYHDAPIDVAEDIE